MDFKNRVVAKRLKALDWKVETNPDFTIQDLMVTVLMGQPGKNRLTLKKSPLLTEIYDGGTLLGSLNDRGTMTLDDNIIMRGRQRNRSNRGLKRQIIESLNDNTFDVEEVEADQDELDRRSNAMRGATSDKVRKVFVDKYGDRTIPLQGGHELDKDIFLEIIKGTYGSAFNKYGEQLAIWSLDGTISDERLDEKHRFIQVLELLVQDHNDEYDEKFSGETPQSLINKFTGEIRAQSIRDKEEAQNMQYKESEYTIVAVKSDSEARKYNKYLALPGGRGSPWCVTEGSWNNYVTPNDSSKAELFYFMLKDGWDEYTRKPEPGPTAPYDEYGLSMIAVSVKEDGTLHTSTLRWNHGNGGNDSSFSQNQLAELAGMPFQTAFPPLTDPKERLAKINRNGYKTVRVGDNSIVLYENRFYLVKNKEVQLDPFDHPWMFETYTRLKNKDGKIVAYRTNGAISDNDIRMGYFGLLDANTLEWILEPLSEISIAEVNSVLSNRLNM